MRTQQKSKNRRVVEMVEIWKPIKGYEGLYEVSNKGRIKALAKKVTKGKCNRSWNEHFLKYGEDSKDILERLYQKMVQVKL